MRKPKTFRPAHSGSRADARADYERWRGSARERGYDARWDRAAATYKRMHPLCVGCRAVGIVTPATVVDHVIPHKGDIDLFWDVANWQASCKWHHDVVKKHLESGFAAGRIDRCDLRLDGMEAVRLTRLLAPTST